MAIEGCLTIDLDRAADGAGRASIASSRPLGLTKAFVGKSVYETVRTLPILFSVCGVAQGVVAAQACERALGIEADAETQAVRELLVHAENVREHLIRVASDWPRFLGGQAQPADMLRIMLMCEGLRQTLDRERRALAVGGAARLDGLRLATDIAKLVRLIEELVLGEPVAAWTARHSAADLERWAQASVTPAQQLVQAVLERGWADAGRAETHFLPHFADAELIGPLLGQEAEDFVAAPTWDGDPKETSALARQADNPLVRDLMRSCGSGLLTRIAARIVEIGAAPGAMTRIIEHWREREDVEGPTHASASGAAPGRAVAQIEAARGRLVHGVEIERDVVCRYAILAPTEWNFHARGSAARGLGEIAGRPHETWQIADLFITAIDPCVGYELRVA